MKTAIKERPILFSGPMVRAILDGRKTQTRRVVKCDYANPEAYVLGVHKDVWGIHEDVNRDGGVWRGKSPYGVTGDRLWVRETWRTGKSLDGHSPKQIEEAASDFGFTGVNGYLSAPVWYVADGIHRKFSGDDYKYFQGTGKTRVSIHMPRWASRINLEITGVRVERLNDITEADALAEGVEPTPMNDAKECFAMLWESINGRGSWQSNPFVWVIEFKRLSLSQTVDQKVDCRTKGATES